MKKLRVRVNRNVTKACIPIIRNYIKSLIGIDLPDNYLLVIAFIRSWKAISDKTNILSAFMGSSLGNLRNNIESKSIRYITIPSDCTSIFERYLRKYNRFGFSVENACNFCLLYYSQILTLAGVLGDKDS